MPFNKFILLYIVTLWPLCQYGQVSFNSEQFIEKGPGITSVCIDDLNGDGLNDVIYATDYERNFIDTNKIFIYYQDSNGKLKAPVKINHYTEYPLLCIKTFDFNYDGRKDIVFGYWNILRVKVQDEFGDFKETLEYDLQDGYWGGAPMTTFAHGDLNNDGKQDLIVGFNNYNWFNIVNYSDTGLVVSKYTMPNVGQPTYKIEVTDVNNDQLDDVVVLLKTTERVLVYTQTLSGSLNYSYYHTNNYSDRPSYRGIAIGDLTGDGTNDLVLTDDYTNKLIVCSQEQGKFTKENNQYYEADSPTTVEVVDLNCDGVNEIVVLSLYEGIEVWEKGEDGTYAPNNVYQVDGSSDEHVYQMAVGDLNNDGLPDVVKVSDYLHFGYFVVLYNNSSPAFFDTLGTSTITIDTLYSEIIREEVYLDTTYNEVRDGNLYAVTDSFYVGTVIQKDSISIDSVYYRYAEMCGTVYRDTIVHDTLYLQQVIISKDSILMNSISVCLDCIDTSLTNVADCELFMPNAFTPDGDGINDVFIPVSECVFNTYRFTVYDRWAGNPIFETTDATEGWHGTHKRRGLDCPTGVYPYTIFYSVGETNLVKSGTVNLLR